MEAATVLAPQYANKQPDGVESMDWSSTDDGKNVCNHTHSEDEKDFQTVSLAISKGNPKRAGIAISRFLSREQNKDVKEEVLKSMSKEQDDDSKTKDLILSGIREIIRHHTKGSGSRFALAETFVQFIVAACLFTIVRNNIAVTDGCLSRIIGASYKQIGIARKKVREMLDTNSIASKPKRKRRKDYIRDKLKVFIFKFLLDDDYTRLDTNQGKVDVIDPATGEIVSVHRRIWCVSTNKRQQHELFLSSDYYKQFQAENNNATAGYTVWMEVLLQVGTFVSNPVVQSCVDEKISCLEHLMAALLRVLRRKNVKEVLKKYQPTQNALSYDEFYGAVRKAGAYQFLDKMCCPKEEQPELHIIEDSNCPKMIPLTCTHGKNGNEKDRCTKCGVRKVQGLLAALLAIPELADEKVEVMVWQDSVRTTNKDGSVGTKLLELKPKNLTIRDLVKNLQSQIELCIPHYQEICWMRHLMETDFKRLPPGTLLIFTDFASSMALRAFQTVNSSVDGHAVNDNFVCIYNRRTTTVKDKKKGENGEEVETEDSIEIFTVDVHHFFGETISKGKKNDHAMHNVGFDDLTNTYKQIFIDKMGVPLENIIIWTDNAPNQYRCRQNFLKVASIEERHPGIRVTHRLAVPHNFKGNHDAVGKDPAQIVKKLELIGIRSPTAYKVFENCFKYLEKTDEVTQWKEYEKTGDARLKNKGRYGMDSRTVHYVLCDGDEDYEGKLVEYSAKHPGRILFCDRRNIQDTHSKQPLNNTNNLHEVRSVATEVPTWPPNKQPRPWPVVTSVFPCNCIRCNADPNNTTCIYAPWRKTRQEIMKEAVRKVVDDNE